MIPMQEFRLLFGHIGRGNLPCYSMDTATGIVTRPDDEIQLRVIRLVNDVIQSRRDRWNVCIDSVTIGTYAIACEHVAVFTNRQQGIWYIRRELVDGRVAIMNEIALTIWSPRDWPE